MKKALALFFGIVLSVPFILVSCASGSGGNRASLGIIPENIIDPAEVQVPQFTPVEDYVLTDSMKEKLAAYHSGLMNFSTNTFPHEMMAGLGNPDVTATEAYVRWNDLEPREGEYNWEKLDKVIDLWSTADKIIELRIVAADSATNITPRWVFDDYNIRRITHGDFFDFEMKRGGYTLSDAAVRTNDPEKVRGQRWSVYAEGGKDTAFFTMKQSRAVDSGKIYSAQLDYKAHTDGIYYMRFIDTMSGAASEDVAFWKGSAGTSASKSATFSLNQPGKWVLEVGTVSGGAISLDNIAVQEVRSGFSIPAYPNFFDPRFQALYERLVVAVKERYGDNPHVEVIQVGPVGRWDEIMLDWQESPGNDNFAQQWQAYGYTDTVYLEHIKWSMNLYRKYFPDHYLRINTAYGLPEVGDTTLIWRQAAELAAEKGIQIKQNGLQEKYFGYGGDTPFPWAAEKARNRPESNIIYETAGQVFRNDTGIGTPIGHPITLFNAAIVQAVDGMFLYPDDIITRRVRAYHHYAVESFGFPLINRWYTRFGSWSVGNETHPEMITWDNIWMRMRPYGSAGTKMTLREIDGEKCTVTDENDPLIILDIDDRARYVNP
ncbi:MAG: beta-galactosidase, partial [Spirochaetales bacterium]|nr:beta-galactosidase [Spirochaetales bacterium]